MTEKDLQQVFAMAEKRDEVRYQWLRHLHLLAAGALTVLVSLQTDTGSAGAAGIAIKASWALLGLGILSGGAALYGAVWKERALLRAVVESHKEASRKRQAGDLAATAGPTVTPPLPFWIRGCELLFLMSLGLAVICLVVFAWLRS